MHYRENDAKFGAKFEKNSQKPNGIGSARNSDADAVAGLEELETPDVG
jgi:hypothetical protein